MDIKELQQVAIQVRRDIVRMVHAVQSGHPGGSLGCTDFLVALYYKFLNHSPSNFQKENDPDDIFILSNGHISPALYSVLARNSYFPISELSTFRKLNSRLQGHPTSHEHLPGVSVATGSLGQGLSVASGAAVAKKINKESQGFVYALLGDGELNEGQNWEAFLFAAHNKLDNLIVTIDVNGLQIDGTTDEVLTTAPLRPKLEAFGWEVLDMNGNNMEEIIQVLNTAKKVSGDGKPICILMTTIMGKGVDYMEGIAKWHGTPPNDEQLARALEQLKPEVLNDY